MVIDGETGLLFEPGNHEDLKEKIHYLLNNPSKIVEMGKNARKVFEEKYTAEKNFEILMEIYNKLIVNSQKINSY